MWTNKHNNQCLNINYKIITIIGYLHQKRLTNIQPDSSQINKQKKNVNNRKQTASPLSPIPLSDHHNRLARQVVRYAKIQDPNWILKYPNQTNFSSLHTWVSL
jgi:hypothetical protein